MAEFLRSCGGDISLSRESVSGGLNVMEVALTSKPMQSEVVEWVLAHERSRGR